MILMVVVVMGAVLNAIPAVRSFVMRKPQTWADLESYTWEEVAEGRADPNRLHLRGFLAFVVVPLVIALVVAVNEYVIN